MPVIEKNNREKKIKTLETILHWNRVGSNTGEAQITLTKYTSLNDSIIYERKANIIAGSILIEDTIKKYLDFYRIKHN